MRSERDKVLGRGAAATVIVASAIVVAVATSRPALAAPSDAATQPASSAAEAPSAPQAEAAAAPASAPAPSKHKVHAARPTSVAGGRIRTDGSTYAHAAALAIDQDKSIVAPEALSLRISAKGRMVSLSGTAGTIYDREQAVRDAEQSARVGAVHTSITIKPATKPDPTQLKAAIVDAVTQANVKGGTFDAEADAAGTAQLNGEVTHEWGAVNAVKKVPGVTAIGGYAARLPGHKPPAATGQLALVNPSPEQDAVIKKKVEDALTAAQIDKVSVAVEKGHVKLGGRLGGYLQAMMASRAASMVHGVLGVENKLTVAGRVYRVGETRDVQEVEKEVRREIRRVMAKFGENSRMTQLSVHVSGGSVMISGRVGSENAAYAAVEAASSVTGVEEVVNAMSYPTNVTGS